MNVFYNKITGRGSDKQFRRVVISGPGQCRTLVILEIYYLLFFLSFIIHSYILLHMAYQCIEYSSLCYTVGPCCLSILYIIIFAFPNSQSFPPTPFLPLGIDKSVLSIWAMPSGLQDLSAHPGSRQWNHRVLNAGSPRNSLCCILDSTYSLFVNASLSALTVKRK